MADTSGIHEGSAYILDVLTRACSQNEAVLKPAEQELKANERKPGFYSALSIIVLNHSVDSVVRWMAVVYFKNGIERYWRSSAPNAISESEKLHLRSQLLQSIDEPVEQISNQLSLLIGKVARIDCPREWGELVPTLAEGVRATGITSTHRLKILKTLYGVVKCLASKRLPPDRRVFKELATSMFSYVCELCTTYEALLEQSLANQQMDGAIEEAGFVITSLKMLKKFIIFGLADPLASPKVNLFISWIFERLNTLVHIKASCNHEKLSEAREHILLTMMKLLSGSLQNFKHLFRQHIKPSLQLVTELCFTQAYQELLFERFIVASLTLLKDIVEMEKWLLRKTSKAGNTEPAAPSSLGVDEYLTAEVLSQISGSLILMYLAVSEETLVTWDADPEDMVCEDSDNAWAYSVEPSSKAVFTSLFKAYPDVLTPYLLTLAQSLYEAPNCESMGPIRQRDAVYHALGLVIYDIQDSLDFDVLLRNVFAPELSVAHSNYRIVRRRVLWLLGRLEGKKLTMDSRKAILHLAIAALDSGRDTVERVEAAATIQSTVDDVGFDKEQFLRDLEEAFAKLVRLLYDLKSSEAKIRVLQTITTIMASVGSLLESDLPHLLSLEKHLPALWESSKGHDLFSAALLSLLSEHVRVLGEKGSRLLPFLIPLLNETLDKANPAHLAVAEDAVTLWNRVLVSIPSQLNPDILLLFTHLDLLIDVGLENLSIYLSVISSYCFQYGPSLFNSHGKMLSQTFLELSDGVRSDALIQIFKTIGDLFVLNPEECCACFPILLLLRVLPAALSLGEHEKNSPQVDCYSFLILVRYMMYRMDTFLPLLLEYAMKTGQTMTNVMPKLVKQWVECLDFVSKQAHRKLMALGLASLLSSPYTGWTAEMVAAVMEALVQILHDVCAIDDRGLVTDSVVCPKTSPSYEYEEYPKKQKTLYERDVVHTVPLHMFLQSHLQSFAGREEGVLLQSVPPSTMEQLRKFCQ